MSVKIFLVLVQPVLTCTYRLMDWQGDQLLSSISLRHERSYAFLKPLTESAFTTSAGRLFQLLTTLWLKKNLLVSSLDLSAQFLLMYCIVSSDSTEWFSADLKNRLLSTCSFLVNNLYTYFNHISSEPSVVQRRNAYLLQSGRITALPQLWY